MQGKRISWGAFVSLDLNRGKEGASDTSLGREIQERLTWQLKNHLQASVWWCCVSVLSWWPLVPEWTGQEMLYLHCEKSYSTKSCQYVVICTYMSLKSFARFLHYWSEKHDKMTRGNYSGGCVVSLPLHSHI